MAELDRPEDVAERSSDGDLSAIPQDEYCPNKIWVGLALLGEAAIQLGNSTQTMS